MFTYRDKTIAIFVDTTYQVLFDNSMLIGIIFQPFLKNNFTIFVGNIPCIRNICESNLLTTKYLRLFHIQPEILPLLNVQYDTFGYEHFNKLRQIFCETYLFIFIKHQMVDLLQAQFLCFSIHFQSNESKNQFNETISTFKHIRTCKQFLTSSLCNLARQMSFSRLNVVYMCTITPSIENSDNKQFRI